MAQQWPLLFSSASDAVRFADGLLNRPRIESQVAQIMRDQQQRVIRSKSEFTRIDYEDQARTISIELEKCQAPQRIIYRHIHGYLRRALEVADQAAHMVWAGPGNGCAAKRKTIAMCRAIAILLLEDLKRRLRYNTRLTKTQIARELRMPRQQLYEQWDCEMVSIVSIYHEWLKICDLELTGRLEQLNMMKHRRVI